MSNRVPGEDAVIRGDRVLRGWKQVAPILANDVRRKKKAKIVRFSGSKAERPSVGRVFLLSLLLLSLNRHCWCKQASVGQNRIPELVPVEVCGSLSRVANCVFRKNECSTSRNFSVQV